MDLWVVVAAAGAGYLSTYWQNLLKERESLSESFSGDSIQDKLEPRPLLQQLCDRTCPFRRLSRRQLGEDVSSGEEEVLSNSDRRSSGIARLGGASVTEMNSTSGSEDEASVNFRKYEDYHLISLSTLSPGFYGKNHHQGKGNGIEGKSEVGDKSTDFLISELSTEERVICYGSSMSRSTLGSKRACDCSVKPLSYLDMEEYVFSLSLPCMLTMRPLFITDGNRIISRGSSDSYRVHFESGEDKVSKEDGSYTVEETVLGVSPLPEITSVKLPIKLKRKNEKEWHRRLSGSNMRFSSKHFQSQGSANGMLLFCIGITIGVMSTVIANKSVEDKLNDLLKQTENLVQDLQEELETKDSLTMKELANEGYESRETNDILFYNWAPAAFSPEQELAELTKYDGKEPHYQKEDENSESMSKIEAELEAELERLELNMNAASFERRLSGIVEINQGLFVDIAQGQLMADMINGGAGGWDDSDQDVSGTSTTHNHTANYAVSPRELSLRLHEVIQSRLEERIMDLEMELEQSQQQMHSMESERISSWRDFSYSELGSSSTQKSPITMEDSHNVTRLLVPNLSGEALDADNEAFEELMKIAEPYEDLPSTECDKNNIYQEGLHPLNQGTFWCQNGGEERGSMPHLKIVEDTRSRSLFHDNIRRWEEQISRSRGSNEVGESEDEDEMGKLLIKRIVEKTRQGSPVVLNARRMLFSMEKKASLE